MPTQTFKLKLSDPATEDFVSLLAYSQQNFGAQAKARYEDLIYKALEQLIENPLRIGSKALDLLVEDEHRIYHLSSAKRGTGVQKPRHMTLYCIKGRDLFIKRVLHDSTDLSEQLNSPDL